MFCYVFTTTSMRGHRPKNHLLYSTVRAVEDKSAEPSLSLMPPLSPNTCSNPAHLNILAITAAACIQASCRAVQRNSQQPMP